MSTIAPPAMNTAKRDYLISLETKAQLRWNKENLFEVNSPYTDGEVPIPEENFAGNAEDVRKNRIDKWFGTFPYPVSTLLSILLLLDNVVI